MAWLAVAAIAVSGAAVPLIGIPRRRKATLYALAFGVLGVMLGACLAVIAVVAGSPQPLTVGVAIPIAASIVTYRWRWLCLRLDELGRPETRDAAAARLHDHMVRLRSRRMDRSWFVSQALDVADGLAGAGKLDEAIELMTSIPWGWLRLRGRQQIWRNNLAVYRMRQGDLAGARELLEGLRESAMPLAREVVRCNEGMLLALEGHPVDALVSLGPDRPARNPARRTWLVARAHALAGQGDEEAARDALSTLVALDGEDALGKAHQPAGPASHIATQLASGAPYR